MRTVANTVRALLIVTAFLICSGVTLAQKPVPRSTPPPPPPVDGITKNPSRDEAPLTTFEEEMRMKRAIRLAEKEHQENLNRAREIAQLGKELGEDLKAQSSIDRNAVKKIERL